MHEYVAQVRQAHIRSDGAVFPLAGQLASGRLTWWPELGIGHYPVEAGFAPYDQAYFDRFDRDARTELGRALMQWRVSFVERHYRGSLVDVGIGCGAFIDLRRRHDGVTYGYDINPAGIEWLEQRKLFVDPYLVRFDAITLWDVLEHMPDFQPLLDSVRNWVFLSLPIFDTAQHVLRSKHFRPDEHYWYFEERGLVHVMKLCGFELISENRVEIELGREDIGTFAFRRKT